MSEHAPMPGACFIFFVIRGGDLIRLIFRQLREKANGKHGAQTGTARAVGARASLDTSQRWFNPTNI